MGRVDGKVAFITGAARGQGRSHAVRLAEEGADIIAIDICEQLDTPYEMSTPEDLAETVRLVEALDRRIVARQADVRDQASLDRAVAEGVAELGRLDIVLANAGICSFDPVEEISEQKWGDMLDINLSGCWRTAKAAIPSLNDGGSIVLTSSAAGLRGYAGLAHYVTAKHGLIGLMRAMAHELGPRGIRVNCVNPTQVETDMLMNQGTYNMFRPDLDRDATKDEFGEASQMGMLIPVPWVQSSDITDAVLFLASDESKFVTALALPVDAGAVSK
ncbi:MAG TPA: mycofactocin-coupled SDR family oxidoreductase [Baekduia sp.]|jgi:SDR family mycofactocin-dependent oxidoreductase|nr:mycofactocin-coupled SDR family oxidoreductase [Baekduia sp.]